MIVTLVIVFSIVTINSEKRITEVTNCALGYFSKNASRNVCSSVSEMLLKNLVMILNIEPIV